MINKISAVEWLLENIHIIPKFKLSVQDTIDKAKEMEKEQIINTFKDAQVLHAMNDQMRAEQYYNETFKKEL